MFTLSSSEHVSVVRRARSPGKLARFGGILSDAWIFWHGLDEARIMGILGSRWLVDDEISMLTSLIAQHIRRRGRWTGFSLSVC